MQYAMAYRAGQQRKRGGRERGQRPGSHSLILKSVASSRAYRNDKYKNMLRVGLTGGLGSGKSAVAMVWTSAGIPVLQADALGRELMQPDQAVYAAIVEAFGPQVVGSDGQLDRAALAREAFEGGGLQRLNAIVHPAVLEAQEAELGKLAAEGNPIAVVESALIFEASGEAQQLDTALTTPGWRKRFDSLVLVAAPDTVRIERFIARVGGPDASPEQKAKLQDDAKRRMAAQLPEEWKRKRCDYIIENDRTLVLLRREALRVLAALRRRAGEP